MQLETNRNLKVKVTVNISIGKLIINHECYKIVDVDHLPPSTITLIVLVLVRSLYLLLHLVLRSVRWPSTLPDVGWPIVWYRKPRFQSPATCRLYSRVAPPGRRNTAFYPSSFTFFVTRPHSEGCTKVMFSVCLSTVRWRRGYPVSGLVPGPFHGVP